MKDKLAKLIDNHYKNYYYFGVERNNEEAVNFYKGAITEYSYHLKWFDTLNDSICMLDIIKYIRALKEREDIFRYLEEGKDHSYWRGAKQDNFYFRINLEKLVEYIISSNMCGMRGITIYKSNNKLVVTNPSSIISNREVIIFKC